ncbi:hypothetical protein FF38_00631 [Lucilia cuprina]|uniref:Uncharacterized protein n=1 Tax=Lucilia cuprina TaxID=7375 RepID=A0A0L0CBM6_LUCCU|nr:hypothetical protein FF38_00631 [Lucilia cuprina]
MKVIMMMVVLVVTLDVSMLNSLIYLMMITTIVGRCSSISYFSNSWCSISYLGYSWCGIGYFGNWYCCGYSYWFSNDGLTGFFNNCIETINFIGSIGDLNE